MLLQEQSLQIRVVKLLHLQNNSMYSSANCSRKHQAYFPAEWLTAIREGDVTVFKHDVMYLDLMSKNAWVLLHNQIDVSQGNILDLALC